MIERIPSLPPVIPPLDRGQDRLRWSVMIPAYNCFFYLKEAIESVLEQGFSPDEMQIEVVDDCSTDGDVAALVAAVGRGRVAYFRQPANVGSLRNFETCLRHARGEYVHLLHGDDRVRPGFYAEIQRLFKKFPQAGAAFTKFDFVDRYGERLRLESHHQFDEDRLFGLNDVAPVQVIQPPAMVVKRSVYEALGSFYAVSYGEDWEMWARIASRYPIAASPKLLASYRVHNNNISTNSLQSGVDLQSVERVIDIIEGYYPKEERRRFRQEAKTNYAAYVAGRAYQLCSHGQDPWLAFRIGLRTFAFHPTRQTLSLLLRLAKRAARPDVGMSSAG